MKTKVFTFILLFFTFTSFGQVNEQDSLALVDLYNTTNGSGWTHTDNWLVSGQPVSTWWGVVVANGRVTELRLQYNNLDGQLPGSFSTLTALEKIYLGYNSNLTGTLPDFSQMQNLKVLSLSSTGISGTFPGYLANMTSLEQISFNYTGITGLVPDLSNLVNLETLELTNFTFEDNKFPEFVRYLTNLERLDFTSCNIEGAVPDFVAESNIKVLIISNNKINHLPEFKDNFMTYLKVLYNELTYADLEYNLDAVQDPTQYYYNIQNPYGEKTYVYVPAGQSITISQPAGGSSTHYQWYKDAAQITGATDEQYTILSFGSSDAGTYYCTATSDILTDLNLTSKSIYLSETGQILNITVENAITHNPITAAEIVAAGQRSLSDIDGKASFGIPSGTYSLKIEADGYKPYETSFTISDDGSEINFTAKLEPETYTSLPDNDIKLKIYPNPAHNIINIPQATRGSILEIYNTTGQMVMQKTINSTQISINLNSGLYLVKLKDKDKIYSNKLIVK